ncbi:MAG TPA: endolytic transglycosylase MltG, partial [Limnochordales bacterium]
VLNWLLGYDQRLQAGDYLLSPDMNLLDIAERLASGQVHTVRVVIPEGLHLRQIADILAQAGLVDRERFLELASDETLVYGNNPPIPKPVKSLEGYLFPDTYLLSPSMTEEQIIRRMVSRFVEVALPIIAAHQAPLNLTPHEVVTLASIVEAEALYAREHPIIASVFLNRLRINMPLQADPTINYLFDEHRSRILYADLAIDSPYNTYRYPGLPPGPIGSPGLSAIRAVLEPASTDYYFFVARGDGTHIFSRTFNEHVRARRQVGR